MALNNHDPGQIREYLLGKLDDQEQQKIEERLMVEDELFDEFEISKDEVIQEYFSGDLSQNERQWLENHYLTSKEGRERHAFLLAMECLDRPAPAPVPVQPVERRPGFFESIRAFFTTRPWAVATASALILVLIFLAFIFRPDNQPRVAVVVERTLTSSVVVRSSGGPLPTKIKLPANTENLRLRLLLPQGATTAPQYRAKLDDRLKTTPIEVTNSDADAVTVIIPANKLPRGEYSVQLFATTTGGSDRAIAGSYLFNIE